MQVLAMISRFMEIRTEILIDENQKNLANHINSHHHRHSGGRHHFQQHRHGEIPETA